MSASPEFYTHTDMLHGNLLGLLGRGAIKLAPGRMLGTGLLNPRTTGNGGFFRPRLIVVSGLADIIGDILRTEVHDDALVVGATRDDDPTAHIGRLYATCPGIATDLLKGGGLDVEEVVMFSHSARIAQAEQPNPDQTLLFYLGLYGKLAQLKQPPSPLL